MRNDGKITWQTSIIHTNRKGRAKKCYLCPLKIRYSSEIREDNIFSNKHWLYYRIKHTTLKVKYDLNKEQFPWIWFPLFLLDSSFLFPFLRLLIDVAKKVILRWVTIVTVKQQYYYLWIWLFATEERAARWRASLVIIVSGVMIMRGWEDAKYVW